MLPTGRSRRCVCDQRNLTPFNLISCQISDLKFKNLHILAISAIYKLRLTGNTLNILKLTIDFLVGQGQCFYGANESRSSDDCLLLITYFRAFA